MTRTARTGREYGDPSGEPSERTNQRSITYLPEPTVRAVYEHVFVRRSVFEPPDVAFFSGFVACDGSFMIRENNAGASWCCALGVKLRADNTPLLAGFREWSGAGQLFASPSRGRSAPQTNWTVARRLDCLRLATILSEYPPLGKAEQQFDIWRRAVHIWFAQGGTSPAFRALATQLRRLHRSTRPVPCRVDITASDLAAFLAGFASAEGHFGASEVGSPSFVINLRADDSPLLRLFQQTFEIGHLREIAPDGASRAALSWRIGRLRDLRRLVAIFDTYPPRGRAGDIYSAWRRLVTLEPRTLGARRALALGVRRRRRYVPGHEQIARTPKSELRERRCRDALGRWARSGEYPGSAVDYERWRRSSGGNAPTRNTIVAAFGSWLRALEAVGLDTRPALAEERVAAIRAAGARRYEARRAASIESIVAAVRRCIDEIGHEPRALEFLRWRAARAPESPSQMTIYRLFPGGFADVLAAALAIEPRDSAG